MATNDQPQQRQRSQSEYPSEVRRAGPRGQHLFDESVKALMGVGMSEDDATMIALLHFPSMFARLAPETLPEEPTQ